MLRELHIVDFALIQEAELHLGPGLNVLTGETGAGKSIIVGAAALLRGGRGSASVVRDGASQAVVEALFELQGRAGAEVEQLVQQAGLPADRQELLVRRVIGKNGRSRIYVNGALCTATVLGRIASSLLDVSGQHEHHLLSDPTTHRRLLDALAASDELLQQMAQAHAELSHNVERLARTRLDDRARAERLEFVRFQLGELSAAQLSAGEDRELETERRRLERAAELAQLAQQGEQELYSGDVAVAGRLARLERAMTQLAAVDPRLASWAGQLEQARLTVEDVGQDLARYGVDVELDPARQAELEQRLDLLHRLCRKHRVDDVEQLAARQQELERELEDLQQLEQQEDTLLAAVQAARERAERLAGSLSSARKQAAGGLGRAVSQELEQLAMGGARLRVQLDPLEARADDEPALCFGSRRVSATGWDRVELVVRTNVGERPQPLRRIASGGELSRVMLALRKTLGQHDPVGTSIYDEVDAGIGGATADVVGRFLAQVARHRQVVCVTHLPQVAAYAGTHFHVGKQPRGRRTVTSVTPLGKRERVAEMARMLGGERVTEAARRNARQLLRSAEAQVATEP